MFLWILWGLGAALSWIGCVCWLCHIWHPNDNWEGFFGRFWLCQTCAGPLHRFCCNFCANPCHFGELTFTLSRMSIPLLFFVYIHILLYLKICCIYTYLVFMFIYFISFCTCADSIVFCFQTKNSSERERKDRERRKRREWDAVCAEGVLVVEGLLKHYVVKLCGYGNTQACVIVWFCRLEEIQVVQDVKKTMWSKEGHTAVYVWKFMPIIACLFVQKVHVSIAATFLKHSWNILQACKHKLTPNTNEIQLQGFEVFWGTSLRCIIQFVYPFLKYSLMVTKCSILLERWCKSTSSL